VVAFSVTDTGIGIRRTSSSSSSRRSSRPTAGTSRKYGGTGLGLAISRELATLLGGEIRLHSSPAKGSTFTLYLPPLDIFLPDMLGWTVLNRLKLDPTRGTSRCRSSRGRRSGSTGCRAARSRTW
jgi:hypothetical protein